jgi:KUP system potassium uptake protein
MNKKTLLLALGALGVVYGDIGTSPLYAINEIFFGHGKVTINPVDVLGSISLVFWALTIVVAFKYVVYVLRADNEGEGGVFALYSLLSQSSAKNTKTVLVICSLLIFAAGLLFGDGIITPAISVISAVEGIKIVTESLANYVVPITIAILTGLFLIQSKGTAKVGRVFGPIVLVWFITIAVLGTIHIVQTPAILAALNPLHALYFLTHTTFREVLWVLGAVMLTITGGEAMYADMGHFGRSPIRFSWFTVAYPALILNYLGQGAFLLSGERILNDNIFYSMVPSALLIPMVFLATFATIIASQALISGAFSLATQAITLGLFPRLKVVHTHHEHEGQQYVPFINWSLYVGCVLLVLLFRSSAALASAYGLAVSGVMLITTLAMIVVTTSYWKWHPLKTALIFIPLAMVDVSFFTANSVKLFEGGFIPLGIAVAIWYFMKTWAWGRGKVRNTFETLPAMTVKHICTIKKNSANSMPRTVILMTPATVQSSEQTVPALKQMFWERYGILPKHLVFLNVKIVKSPHVYGKRYEVTTFYEDKTQGSVRTIVVKFGFMEELNVEKALFDMAADRSLPIGSDATKWLVHIANERMLISSTSKGFNRIRLNLFRLMLRNSERADHFFGLGNKIALSVEVLPVKFG